MILFRYAELEHIKLYFESNTLAISSFVLSDLDFGGIRDSR